MTSPVNGNNSFSGVTNTSVSLSKLTNTLNLFHDKESLQTNFVLGSVDLAVTTQSVALTPAQLLSGCESNLGLRLNVSQLGTGGNVALPTASVVMSTLGLSSGGSRVLRMYNVDNISTNSLVITSSTGVTPVGGHSTVVLTSGTSASWQSEILLTATATNAVSARVLRAIA